MVGGPNEPYPLPDDPALAEVSGALNAAGHWAMVVDERWHVVYVTDDLRLTFGGGVEFAEFALGEHLYSTANVALRSTWTFGPTTTAFQRRGFAAGVGLMVADAPGGKDEVRAAVDPSLHDIVDDAEPVDGDAIALLSASGGPAFGRDLDIPSVTLRIRDSRGRLRGSALLQKPAVGMNTIAAMVASIDLTHLARMQSVAIPDRRPSALLFADLESSTPLSRRLSTASYFRFARRLTRVADLCVVDAGGVVGRHAGDGVVAFFLAQSFGSESQAARACIEAAHSLRAALHDVAARSEIDADEVVLRFGLHWSSTVYVGNVTTVGRTEVIALGDEVNEAARIEACATGGRMLASKVLLERLDREDARAVDIDLGRVGYTTLADLTTATDKARRDAPAVAVVDLAT